MASSPSQPPRLVALCINLDRATDRWRHVQTRLAPALEPVPLLRLPAVDGRRLPDADLAAHLTVHARWSLAHRPRVCDRTMLNTREAVGCYLSHRDAWIWLAHHAHLYDAAIILEDDCCLEPGLPSALLRPEGALAPLLRRPAEGWEWDVLWLGYTDLLPPVARPRRPTVRLAGGRVVVQRPDVWCYGAHCYLVSVHGARRLVALALPAELHLDFWIQIAAVLGEVRGYLVTRSWASQCRRTLEPGIPHFAWGQVNWKLATPDLTVRGAGTLGLAVLVVVALLFLLARRAR